MDRSNHACGRAAAATLGVAVLALSLACGGSGSNGGGGTVVGGGGYSLELSATSVALSADRNGYMPAKTVMATFVGDGLVAGYPPGVSAPGWLSVSIGTPAGGSATVTLRTNTTSLTPGDYQTTVRIVTGKQDGSVVVYKDVAVDYVVRAGLQAATAPMSFSSVDGIAAPLKTLTLTSDVLPKAWTLAVQSIGNAPSDWVVLPATSGTLSTASADVQVGAAARPPGTYNATLVVKDDTGLTRAGIQLTYNVTAAFTLSGTLSTRVTEAATLASLDLPLALHTNLDAATGAGRTWQATSTADWVSVVPTSGDLSADAILAVRLDPAKLWALANGYYGATITVAAQAGGTTASVPVSLNLALQPALTAPATVSWTIGAASTTADLARAAMVSTNLGEAFKGHGAWHATTPAAWLQVTPSSATDGGNLTLAVAQSALAGLANGAQAATVTLTADDARVASAKVQANVQIALPDVAHVAPYTTWVGRAPDVILRGSGFGASGTLPVLFGTGSVTGTVVSDTELHATAPTQAAAGRVPVSIGNALGVARQASELVVLAAPGYTSYQTSLTTSPQRMILDPERQAVLLGGAGAEVRRIAFANGAWSQDAFSAPTVTGGYLTADGKTLFVTSGNTGSSSQVFYEVDPATLQIRKQAGYSSYYARYDLAAGFNDGRLLVIDSEQWANTIWYPSLANGLYVDAHNPFILVTRDRSRMIVADDGTSGISSYDVADVQMTKRAITQRPWYGRDWSVSGDGGRLAIDASVYDRSFNFLGTVSLPEPGVGAVAVSPDGATLYTLAQTQDTPTSPWYWVFRRTGIGGAPPYTADATRLSISIGATESPVAMAVSEDGSTLFLLTRAPTGSTGTIFRAVPLN
jgi:hypothetical protein